MWLEIVLLQDSTETAEAATDWGTPDSPEELQTLDETLGGVLGTFNSR